MTTKEKIQEAIKILGMYDRNCKISMGYAMHNTKKYLKENFDLSRGDKWKIEQFNRNRAPEDQVKTIKEMNARVKEAFTKKYIYESPDGGKTIYRRKFGESKQLELNFNDDIQLELFEK